MLALFPFGELARLFIMRRNGSSGPNAVFSAAADDAATGDMGVLAIDTASGQALLFRLIMCR